VARKKTKKCIHSPTTQKFYRISFAWHQAPAHTVMTTPHPNNIPLSTIPAGVVAAADDDVAAAAADDALTKPRSIFRGTLALLRNVKTLERYPFNVQRMKTTKAVLRSKRKNRQQRKAITTDSTTTTNNDPIEIIFTEEDVVAKTEFLLIFLFHPRQPHSLKLRSIVADFCYQQSSRVVGMGLYGGDLALMDQEEQHNVRVFLDGTGLCTVPVVEVVVSTATTTMAHSDSGNFASISAPQDDDNNIATTTSVATINQNACSNLIDFLNITQIPSVVIIPTNTGRPIVGQDVALTWNASNIVLAAVENPTHQQEEEDKELNITDVAQLSRSRNNNSNTEAIDVMMERWQTGKSGLTFSQSLLATTMGDSSSVCNLM